MVKNELPQIFSDPAQRLLGDADIGSNVGQRDAGDQGGKAFQE